MESFLLFLEQNIDVIAFAFFVLCLVISLYSRKRARKIENSGKSIRSHYRSNWIENMVKKNDYNTVVQEMRNNIAVSVAFVSSIIIAFGLVLNAASTNILSQESGFIFQLKIFSVVSMLAYGLFMIVVELRTLLYIPVVFGTDEALIKQYDGVPKTKYLSHLVHDSFDHFSNTIRAIFYLVALLTWFYNAYIFIVVTILLTVLMIVEDFGKESRITIF